MLTRLHHALGASALLALPLQAQTDYYNTDVGHPLATEDASALERFALELRPAAVTLSRHTGGVYAVEIESEVTYGILPRTQVEAGVAWRRAERGSTYQSGLAGLTLGALHALNVETRTLPALALAAELSVPAGSMAARERYLGVRALVTRTFPVARLHLNAGYTLGEAPRTIVLVHGVQTEVPRWRAGIAADKAFALRSLLIAAEIVAERPTLPAHPTIAEAGAGLRWQWTPRVVVDAGVARHLTGDDRAWELTASGSYALGLRL